MFNLSFFVIHNIVFIRFLVHRYSEMREHVEANKIEGVDDVDNNYMETGKAQYNDDSDQVTDTLWSALCFGKSWCISVNPVVLFASLRRTSWNKVESLRDVSPSQGSSRQKLMPSFPMAGHSCCSHMPINICYSHLAVSLAAGGLSSSGCISHGFLVSFAKGKPVVEGGDEPSAE